MIEYVSFALLVLVSSAGNTLNAAPDSALLNEKLDAKPGVLSFELLPGRKVFERRMREMRRLEDGEPETQIQIDGLYQGYGTHYVDLWIGTPVPQRQTVIVDTGSSSTAFPCKGCKNCGEEYHTDFHFDPSLSETFEKLDCDGCKHGSCRNEECNIHMSYAEGSSWSAYEAKDYLYAGGSHRTGEIVTIEDGEPVVSSPTLQFETQFAFGCQMSLTGLFRTQLADGIMGMSRESYTFWDQMYTNGQITRKQFSLCFSRQPTASSEGTGAGAMTVGGLDDRFHKTPMVWAWESGGRSFFTVYIKNIFLREGGGESARPDSEDQIVHRVDIAEGLLNSRGVIVDSGTTDTYFTSALAGPFKNMWKEITGKDYANRAVSLTEQQLRSLPTVLVQLRGADDATYDDPETTGLAGGVDSDSPNDIIIAIPASHYMEYDSDDDKYSTGLFIDEHGGSVLGANTMQGHNVFFDMETNQIGFAESDCEYSAESASGAGESI
mmetsp:Transcript_13741/g.20058  ORF Transcript_13741/g.20058 Transcript_13741/m.20058 type:complete len:493 (+) Transcript_13741:177-1655(+)